MASLNDSIISNTKLSSMGYTPVTSDPIASKPTPANNNLEPAYNAFIRCPLPPVWQASPDSLRQFYNKGVLPQTRLFNPNNPTG